MIAFDRDNVRFNLRAVAVAVHEEHVLLHRIGEQPYWCLPGGRVEMRESSAQSLAREMREELEAEVRIERLLWVVENFFSLGAREFHELGLYYLIALPADSPYLDLSETYLRYDAGTPLTFHWFAFEELNSLDLQPAFLARAIPRLPTCPQHIVTRDVTPA